MIQLKHLDLVTQQIDYAKIVVEIYDFKNTFFNRLFKMRGVLKKAISQVRRLSEIDLQTYKDLNNCQIKYPLNVDALSYQCRLEISRCLSNNQLSHKDRITQTIALACFSTAVRKDFDSDSIMYQKFIKTVESQDLLSMIALYNVLIDALNESNDKWNRLFDQVRVTDADFEQAGGPQYLGRFNYLKTSKKLISDFGVSYDEAFQLPYNLVQWNELEEASKGFVQQSITKLKEREMERQRKRNTPR